MQSEMKLENELNELFKFNMDNDNNNNQSTRAERQSNDRHLK